MLFAFSSERIDSASIEGINLDALQTLRYLSIQYSLDSFFPCATLLGMKHRRHNDSITYLIIVCYFLYLIFKMQK